MCSRNTTHQSSPHHTKEQSSLPGEIIEITYGQYSHAQNVIGDCVAGKPFILAHEFLAHEIDFVARQTTSVIKRH